MKRIEKRKAGKTPGYHPIVGITDPYSGSYKYNFIISEIQKKINRIAIIYNISFLKSLFNTPSSIFRTTSALSATSAA